MSLTSKGSQLYKESGDAVKKGFLFNKESGVSNGQGVSTGQGVSGLK